MFVNLRPGLRQLEGPAGSAQHQQVDGGDSDIKSRFSSAVFLRTVAGKSPAS